MSVTGIYADNAMLIQICESVKISKVPESALMNLKTDWNYFRIPNPAFERWGLSVTVYLKYIMRWTTLG